MQNHNPPFSPLIDSFLIQRKRQVRGRAAIIWKRASEMLHWTLLQETKRRFFSPFPPSDSFPVLLASITCAEANASTLGNNQSKEVTDGGGGTRLFFFFFSWLKAYLKSEECVRGTLQHLPAPFPLSEQRQASLQLLHTARFPELSVLPCLCSPCPRCTGAASQRASSISSYLSSSHCSLFPYFCKATLHALSKLHFKPTHTSSSVPVLPLTSTYPQLNYSPHIFDPWRLLQNNESSQKWPQENTFS